MKKSFKYWFILILLLAIPCFGEGADSSLYSEIEGKTVDFLRKNFIQWEKADLVVTPKFDKFKVDKIEKIKDDVDRIIVSLPKGGIPSSEIIVLVELFKQKKLLRKFYLRNKVQAYDNVYVARQNIAKNEIFSSQNIVLKKVNITPYSNTISYFKNGNKLFNKEAKTDLQQGKLLLTWMVQDVPVFRRGEVLNIFFQGEGIRLKFKGIAQEDGFEGKYVRLKRKSNGKLLTGKVVYGNNVLIY